MPIPTKQEAEKWARASLAVLTQYDISHLEHADKPDLQDIHNDVGIEVVEDCYPEERKHQRFIEEVFDLPFDQIPEEKIERFKKEGGSIKEHDNKIERATLWKPTDNNPNHLIKTIYGKNEKLNAGGYTIFGSNRLYVDVNTVSPLFDSYVVTVMEEVAKFDGKYHFDVLYLFCWFEFLICDLTKKTFERIDVTREMRKQIKSLM